MSPGGILITNFFEPEISQYENLSGRTDMYTTGGFEHMTPVQQIGMMLVIPLSSDVTSKSGTG